MEPLSLKPVILNMRCVAFTGEGARSNRIKVDGDVVRVWDSVAGHYTLCHSLSESARKRAIRDARALVAGQFDESHTCYFEKAGTR